MISGVIQELATGTFLVPVLMVAIFLISSPGKDSALALVGLAACCMVATSQSFLTLALSHDLPTERELPLAILAGLVGGIIVASTSLGWAVVVPTRVKKMSRCWIGYSGIATMLVLAAAGASALPQTPANGSRVPPFVSVSGLFQGYPIVRVAIVGLVLLFFALGVAERKYSALGRQWSHLCAAALLFGLYMSAYVFAAFYQFPFHVIPTNHVPLAVSSSALTMLMFSYVVIVGASWFSLVQARRDKQRVQMV